MVRLISQRRQICTRTLQRTAEPEWGDREEFLFPAPSGDAPFTVRLESGRSMGPPTILGTVGLEARFFLCMPALAIHTRLQAQEDVVAKARARAEAAKAAATQPAAASAAADPAPTAAKAARVPSQTGAQPGGEGGAGGGAGDEVADDDEEEEDPTVSVIPPLSTLGASSAPAADGVLGGVPVYSQPVQCWFALRDGSGAEDGEYRGEVQLAVSWEQLGDGASEPPEQPIRVSAGGEAGDGAATRVGATQDGDTAKVGGRGAGEPLAEEEAEEAEQERAQQEMLEGMSLEDGDYRVLVHVIQAKDLHPEDPNGTADPCVFAEVLGKKMHTRTMWGRTSCYFDQVMWFDFKGLTKQEIETATIRLAVFDVDMITSNDLIGEYSLDCSYVYFREHHELHNQWIGISDPSNADKEGVQGFLKLSVAVLGPKDKRYAWDPRDEEREAAEDADKGITARLLMPPAVDRKLEYLVVAAHQAEHLPALDAPQLFGLIQGGIDAFVQVDFGGGVPARTHRVTRKGPSGELDPSWSKQNELWIPVLTPTMSTRVRIALWDEDFALFGNTLCSTFFLDYARVRRRAVVRRWFNLYGAPVYADGDEARRMNEYPDVASTYRGRLLLSARVVTDDKEIAGHAEVIHAEDAARVMRALRPPTARYELRALVISGSEVPQRTALLGAIAEGLGLSARDVGIEVRVGHYVLMTTSKTPKHRSVHWNEVLGVGTSVELPADVDQIPDIFVYLFRGSGTRRVPISYARFTPKELLERGFTQPASWLHLQEDVALNAVPSDEQPGSILMRLGFGNVDAAAGVDDWDGEAEEAALTAPYAVRVHVYQGRQLPATDSNGSTDPWVRVQVGGQTARTQALKMTTCPLWYEPLELRLDLPQRVEFVPELLVQLWDENFFADTKVGQLRIALSDPAVPKHRFASSGATDLPTQLPRPTWQKLWARNREAEGSQGELLIGVQLIALDRLDVMLPPVVKMQPKCTSYFVEVVALGMRDLKPFLGFPIYDPSVEFDVGDRKASGGMKATKHSKKPSGTNPNFGERLLLNVQLPIDPIFAPSLNLTVRDRRLGGWSTPIVATASIPLADKYPSWDGRPAEVAGTVVTENPHFAELEAGEMAPDAARLAVKAAAKRQSREVEAKLRSKLRKKMKRRTQQQRRSGGNGDQGAGAFAASGAGGESVGSLAYVSGSTATGGAAGGEEDEEEERATLLGGSRGGSDPAAPDAGSGVHPAYAMSEEERSQVLSEDAGEMSSDVDDVSSDEEDEAKSVVPRHLRKAGGGSKKAGSVADEASLLLRRHRVGTAASVRSRGSKSIKGVALGALGVPAVGPAAAADASPSGLVTPGPGALQVATGAQVVEEAVLGDAAADIDFRLYAGADEDGGLAAVAGANRDEAAEEVAGEAVSGGDLSWLYRHLKRADAAEGLPAEDKAVGYLSGRREYDCGLEEALVSAPFETYDVRRGSALPRGNIFGFRLRSTNRRVGVFKGIVRIIKDPKKTPPPVALESLLKPEKYLVRVYAMDGRDFMPMDGMTSDPYLVLSLGDERISDRRNYIPKTLSPGFFRCYEIPALLPGPSRLHIAAWDYDFVTFDDFIGETVVDIEDRWFDQRWQSLGMSRQTDERLAPRPVEDRTLHSPTFFGSCGQLRLWIDILTPGDAARFAKIDITPPPPRPFQLRVIVWRARDVASGDRMTSMNDLYTRCWIEGQRPQETDTHWRAKGGKGSFNWRFKFDIELPYDHPVLTFQLWDRDILKWNDCIAESSVDISPFFRKARFAEKPYQVFDDNRRRLGGGEDADAEGDDDPQAQGGTDGDEGSESAPSSSSSSGDDADDGSGSDAAAGVGAGEDVVARPIADDADIEAGREAEARWARAAAMGKSAETLRGARKRWSADRRRSAAAAAAASGAGEWIAGDDDGGEALLDEGDPIEAVGGADEEGLAEQAAERARMQVLQKAMAKARRKAARAQRKAAEARREQRAKARGRIVRSPTEEAENIALDLVTKEERDRILGDWDPEREETELDKMALQVASDQSQATEAAETINSFRTMLGIPQHPKAENSKWIPCVTNYVDGRYQPRKRGEVLVSVELVPGDMVESYPAGRGRAAPNMNPMLPPPAGRMRFSLNPFYLGNAICGPALFQRCLICLCLLIAVVVMVMGGPFLTSIAEWYSIIGWPTNFIILSVVLVVCCGPTICLCVRSCVRESILAALEARPDGKDDHEVLGDAEGERGVESGGVQSSQGAEAGPGGNFGRSAAEPTSSGEADYGFMEEEEREMFLRDAALLARARGMRRMEQMGLITKPTPAQSKPDEADP